MHAIASRLHFFKGCPRLSLGCPRRQLWKDANLEVKPGQFGPQSSASRRLPLQIAFRAARFVLLSAPEGTGKSCFFRAMAGIWLLGLTLSQLGSKRVTDSRPRPHASGEVYLPAKTLFLPQKPAAEMIWHGRRLSSVPFVDMHVLRSYIPQGTLKQAVAYPSCSDPTAQRWDTSQRFFRLAGEVPPSSPMQRCSPSWRLSLQRSSTASFLFLGFGLHLPAGRAAHNLGRPVGKDSSEALFVRLGLQVVSSMTKPTGHLGFECQKSKGAVALETKLAAALGNAALGR